MDKKHEGILAVIGASMMWAVEPIFAKLSYHNSDFLNTSAIRAFVVAGIALVYMSLKRANPKVSKKNFSVLLYLGLVGTLFADLLYLFAMTQIPVLNAVLVAHMQPIFIVLIGFLILRGDKLTKFDYAGISLMMLSGLMVTTKTLGNLNSLKFGSTGDLMVLAATIAWATAAIAVRKYLTNLHSSVITFYRFIIASIFFAVYLSMTSGIIIKNVYQIMVGIAVGIGTILYYEGLKRIKAAQVSAVELSSPFFAAIIAFFCAGRNAHCHADCRYTPAVFGNVLSLKKRIISFTENHPETFLTARLPFPCENIRFSFPFPSRRMFLFLLQE